MLVKPLYAQDYCLKFGFTGELDEDTCQISSSNSKNESCPIGLTPCAPHIFGPNLCTSEVQQCSKKALSPRAQALSLKENPKLLQEFDQLYERVQEICLADWRHESNKIECQTIAQWDEPASYSNWPSPNQRLQMVADELSLLEGVNQTSDGLAGLVEFSDRLDNEGQRSLIGEVKEDEDLLRSHSKMNSTKRVGDSERGVGSNKDLQDVCQFLVARSWQAMDQIQINQWAQLVEKVHHSIDQPELQKDSFCFLKNYYEQQEKWDELFDLLLKMPEGENFCIK